MFVCPIIASLLSMLSSLFNHISHVYCLGCQTFFVYISPITKYFYKLVEFIEDISHKPIGPAVSKIESLIWTLWHYDTHTYTLNNKRYNVYFLKDVILSYKFEHND